MMVLAHFALPGFTNSYIIGGDQGGDALIIDPGVMDIPLLKLIEENNYYIRHILVTHSHDNHVKGIQTLRRIYQADIYSNNPRLYNFNCTSLSHEQELDLSGFKIKCIALPGHSSDSMIYEIRGMLFTGDSLTAGRIGETPNSFTRANLLQNLRERILNLPGDAPVFPGHGPPSTLACERSQNIDLFPPEEYMVTPAGSPPPDGQSARRVVDKAP